MNPSANTGSALAGVAAPLFVAEAPWAAGAHTADQLDRSVLPIAEPRGAPNVVIVLIDDMGFARPSSFGGPMAMPTLDNPAQNGLRCNHFPTTALCPPTRAALKSGRNHHQVNMAYITELTTGFPGATGQTRTRRHHWPRRCAWSLYVKDGVPAYDYNFLRLQRTTITSTEKLVPGKAELRLEFDYDGGGPAKGGEATLFVNGEKVAEGRIPATQPGIFSADETADVGIDLGAPVVEAIGAEAKSRFSGAFRS